MSLRRACDTKVCLSSSFFGSDAPMLVCGATRLATAWNGQAQRKHSGKWTCARKVGNSVGCLVNRLASGMATVEVCFDCGDCEGDFRVDLQVAPPEP